MGGNRTLSLLRQQLSAEPAVGQVCSWRVGREAAGAERSYFGHTRLLGG
jgi:hypothetical protein